MPPRLLIRPIVSACKIGSPFQTPSLNLPQQSSSFSTGPRYSDPPSQTRISINQFTPRVCIDVPRRKEGKESFALGMMGSDRIGLTSLHTAHCVLGFPFFVKSLKVKGGKLWTGGLFHNDSLLHEAIALESYSWTTHVKGIVCNLLVSILARVTWRFWQTIHEVDYISLSMVGQITAYELDPCRSGLLGFRVVWESLSPKERKGLEVVPVSLITLHVWLVLLAL